MGSKRPVVLTVLALAAVLGGLWWAQSMMGGALLPEPGPAPGEGPSAPADPLAEAAGELNARQRLIADTLVEAQRVDLSEEQLAAFEAALDSLRGTPAERETWSRLKSFESAFPLFAASEDALFRCLRGRSRGPKACEPSAEYRALLASGVKAGTLSRAESDKYLEILSSLKDPKVTPALPPGGLEFMERESQTKVRNFRKIADAVRRAESAPQETR